MFDLKKLVSNLLILFWLFPKISIESNSWIYENNKNIYCDNKLSCHSVITSNNPYFPLIPKENIKHALLGSYYYIYISFLQSYKVNQKVFYIEVNDIVYNQNLISNGDCYLIDLIKNQYYEFRIYKELSADSLIQLQFLGLNLKFAALVEVSFGLDIFIFGSGIKLDLDNSLLKLEQNSIIKYLDELEIKKADQNIRKSEAVEKTKKILKSLFGKIIDITFDFNHNFFTTTFPVSPFFLVTVSISVGLDLSVEKIFKDNEKIISETTVMNGEITSRKNIFDFLGDEIDIANPIKKLVEILTGKIDDMILNLGLSNDYFTLTISTSPMAKYIDILIRFYDPITKAIYYEIDIKIELKDSFFLKPVQVLVNSLVENIEVYNEFIEKYQWVIFAIILATVILFVIIIFGAGSIPISIGSGISAILTQITMSMQPVLEKPIFSFG